MKIDIKETQEWYANERSIKIEEFDDYDAHVCRVANVYGNAVKKLTIPVVDSRRELLMSYEQFGCTPDYWIEHGKDHATKQIDIYLEAH